MILKTEKYQKSNQKSNFVKKILSINAVFVFLFASCSNFIHELVPPQEKEIVFFGLKTENKESVRSVESKNEKNITLTVPSNTDVTNLIPVIRVSDGASVLPLTLPYLFSAFPSMDLLTLSVKLNEVFSSKSVENWVFNFIQQNPDFNVPELSLPIDFSDPVYFLVVSGQGNTELYKVAVQKEPSSNSSDEQNPKDNSDGGDDSKDYSSVEKDILSFLVNAQEGESLIKEKSVEFSISNEVDISKLYPVVTVSQGASVLPLTQNYILSLNISFDKMLDFYSGYSTSKNLEKYCSDWLKNNDVELPKNLSLPIDFRESVVFAVVGSDKSVKLYTIKCNVLNNTPFIKTFAFTKDKNSGLMKDCFVQEKSEKNYFAQLVYPVDYSDFALVPELVYYGDKITCKIGENEEIELVSGVTQIPFTAANKTCTIMLYKADKKIEYSLTVNQTFDPDTIRSITDFRFYKSNNKDIKSSVMASIYDEGDTGQITITVNYQDQIPEILIPTFYSPGTVSVNQVEQVSGTSSQNFSLPVQYLCVSKNKMFSRLYTVYVEFNKVEPATALINSFNFSAYLNKGISYDVQGVINDVNGTIDVEIPYSGESEPYSLTAQFAGTGTIYVDGIVQSSGYSVQNFSNNVYYKVVASDDESVSKQYVVRVSFKKDTDSLCEITSFKFLRSSQNPKLNEDVSALVVQRTKEIFVHLPFGSGSMDSLLTATFEAVGQVFVGEELQVSGFSKNDFSNVLTYKVVSANGKNSKEYTVTVQESGSVIYVNSLATGHNNGSSWQDAYITLDSALESIQNFGEQNSCEIWICDNGSEYKAQKLNNPLPICGTISIKGGFSGNETSAGERDSSKKTKISSYCFDSKGSECSLSFERLELGTSGVKFIKMQYESTQTLQFKDCVFSCLSNAIYLAGNKSALNIENTLFQNTSISVFDGIFNAKNSVFENGEIFNLNSSVQNCDFTEVTFKNTKISSKSDVQTIKNCVFKDYQENSRRLNFYSNETKIYNCNFDNFYGEIKGGKSIAIQESDFSEKAIFIINNSSFDSSNKFVVENCNRINFKGITNIAVFKIKGKSKDEKCLINTNIGINSKGTAPNSIYVENVDSEYRLYSYDSSYATNICDLYVNNCKFNSIYLKAGYLEGGIFYTNANTVAISPYEKKEFLIENCNIITNDNYSDAISFSSYAPKVKVSNSIVKSNYGCFSSMTKGQLSIVDSNLFSTNFIFGTSYDGSHILRNVQSESSDFFYRGNSYGNFSNLEIKDCNFNLIDNQYLSGNETETTSSVDISNSTFNKSISFSEGFNSVKITDNSSFNGLKVVANKVELSDITSTSESTAMSLTSYVKANIKNSNFYSKNGYAFYEDEGNKVSIENCKFESDSKTALYILDSKNVDVKKSYMQSKQEYTAYFSNVHESSITGCTIKRSENKERIVIFIDGNGTATFSENTFSDNNMNLDDVYKRDIYSATDGKIVFTKNKLIESPLGYISLILNNMDIHDNDAFLRISGYGLGDVSNSNLLYINATKVDVSKCNIYCTADVFYAKSVHNSVFYPYKDINTLNLSVETFEYNKISDITFSYLNFSYGRDNEFQNCNIKDYYGEDCFSSSFNHVNLLINKDYSSFRECDFQDCNLTCSTSPFVANCVNFDNSIISNSTILLNGNDNFLNYIICKFCSCTFNNSSLKKNGKKDSFVFPSNFPSTGL